MLKTRILILMITLFSLSQGSNLVMALLDKGKNMISMIMDCEESEKFENEELNSDTSVDLFCIQFDTAPIICSINLKITDPGSLPQSVGISPETPPPNKI